MVLVTTLCTPVFQCRINTSAPQLPAKALLVESQLPSVDVEITKESSGFLYIQRGYLLHQRYRVHAKLGGGVSSTTWLVEDVRHSYVLQSTFWTVPLILLLQGSTALSGCEDIIF
jgi:hypothetical protein